jgi:NAD(P)-dependent dehydrogenase (short-subunit alcohol dehydrogenase family)
MATAIYLAEKGYSVVATSRSDDRLAVLKSLAAERRLPISTVVLDVNSDEAVNSVLPGVLAEHGGVDALINNAGYSLWGPGESLSIGELRDVFETNFYAAFRMMQGVLPGMTERVSGTIVNVTSVEGRIVTPFNGGYGATKFALEGLSEAMRLELWPLGVRVVVIEPGLYSTNLFANQVVAERTEASDLPYGPLLARYRKNRAGYDRLAKDPVKVARVIHRAIRSKRPRFRYTVGAEATLGILASRYLPERLFQTLVSRALLR